MFAWSVPTDCYRGHWEYPYCCFSKQRAQVWISVWGKPQPAIQVWEPPCGLSLPHLSRSYTILTTSMLVLQSNLIIWNNAMSFSHSLCRNCQKKALVIGCTFALNSALIYLAYAASFRFGAWLIEKGRTDIQEVFLWVNRQHQSVLFLIY